MVATNLTVKTGLAWNNGIEIHNPYWILLKFWVQTRKPQDKQDSKINSLNGSWYFSKTYVDGKWYIVRNIYFVIFSWLSYSITVDGCLIDGCPFRFAFKSRFNSPVAMKNNTALQIRGGQCSITTNLRPLTTNIYYVMIIVTGGFSKKYFYYYYFLKILLINLELVFLGLKNFYKTHRTSLFYFYLFSFDSFPNHFVYQHSPAFHTFPVHVNTQDESLLFLLVVSQSLCIYLLYFLHH